MYPGHPSINIPDELKGGLVHREWPQFGLPIKSGFVPVGDEVRQTLVRIRDSFRRYYSHRDINASKEIERFLRDYATSKTFTVSRRKTLHGHLDHAWLFSCFYDPPFDPAGHCFDGVRLVLLFSTLQGRSQAVGAIQEVASVLGQADAGSWKGLSLKIAQCLTSLETDFDELESLIAEFGIGTDSSRKIVKAFRQRIRQSLADNADRPSTPTTAKKRKPSVRAHPINDPGTKNEATDDGIHIEDLETVLRWGVPGLGDDEPLRTLPAEINEPEFLPLIVEEQRQAYRSWLLGPVLPDTDRVLAPHEAADAYQCLWPHDHVEPDREIDVFGRIVVSLILLTGRHREPISESLLSLLRGTPKRVSTIELHYQRWRSISPLDYPQNKLNSKWFAGCHPYIELAYPSEIAAAIQRLRVADWTGVIRDNIDVSVEQALQTARAKTRRASQSRLGFTLASAVYLQTGHNRDWQLLCGLDGYQSTAPLHYYAPTCEELQAIYVAATAYIGIDVPSLPQPPAQRVGANFAAIELDSVRASFSKLKTNATADYDFTSGRAGTPTRGVNAITAYTLVWFALLVAHRCTSPLWSISRRQVIRMIQGVGFAAFSDKGHKSVSTRITALTSAWLDQLESLLHWYSKRATELRRRGSVDHSLIRALEAAIDGTGPLFVFVDDATEAPTSPTREFVASCIPEWDLPLERVRHIFATHAPQFGLLGGDLAQQMGHSIDSTPFGPTDPESPLEFANRVSSSLKTFEDALGLAPIGQAPKAARQKLALTAMPLPAMMKAEVAETKAYRAHLTTLENPEDDFDPAVDVEAVWQRLESEDEWPRKEEIAAAFSVLVGDQESLAQARAIRCAAIEKIDAAKKCKPHRRWLRSAIAPVAVEVPPPSPITQSHLEAYRSTEALITQIYSHMEGRPEALDLVLDGLFVLSYWGFGSELEMLLTLLDAEKSALRTHPNTQHLLVDAPTQFQSDADSSNRQLLVFHEDAAPLFVSLRETFKTLGGLNNQRLENVSVNSPVGQLIAPHKDGMNRLRHLLRTVGRSRSLTVSPVRRAFEQQEIATKGLDPARFVAVIEPEVRAISKADRYEDGDNRAPTGRSSAPRGSGYETLRSRLGRCSTAPSNLKARTDLLAYAKKLQRDELAPQATTVLAEAILDNAEAPTLQVSSIYQYISTLTTLIQRLNGVNLRKVDPDIVIAWCQLFYVESLAGKRKKSKAVGVPTAMSWYLKQLHQYFGIDISIEDVLEGVEEQPPVRVPPGYAVSAAEMNWLDEQYRIWVDTQFSAPSVGDASIQLASSHYGYLIQSRTAARQMEICGARTRDVAILDESVVLDVLPRRSRGLKSTASRRQVNRRSIGINTEQQLKRSSEILRGRRVDEDINLLATGYRSSLSSVASVFSMHSRRAYRQIIEPRFARGHAWRHTYATAASIGLQPDAFEGVPVRLPPVKAEHIAALPLRVQALWFSRQLGHGARETTIIWYEHATAMRSDHMRFQRRAPIKTLSAVTGKPLGSCNNRSFLNHHYVRSQQRAQRPLTCGLAEHSDTNSPHGMASGTPDLAALGELVLRIRENPTRGTVANQIGISQLSYERLVEEAELIDRARNLEYLTPKRQRGPMAASRVPQAHALLRFLHRVDGKIKRSDFTPRDLGRWCIVQTSTPAAPPEFPDDPVIEEITGCLKDSVAEARRKQNKQPTQLDLDFVRLVIELWIHLSLKHD